MPPSYAVTSMKAVLSGLGQERDRGLQTLDAQSTNIEMWLQQQVETYCNQVLQRSHASQPPAKKQKLSSLTSDDEQHVMALRVKDLQKELKERGLDCQGLKQELRQRLMQALAEEKRAPPNNKLLLQPENVDLSGNEPNNEPMELDPVTDAAGDENRDAAVPPREGEGASKRKPVKRSRSPLRIVQVGVQSAMKKMMLKSTWSPAKGSSEDDSGQPSPKADFGVAASQPETEDMSGAKRLETDLGATGTTHSPESENLKSAVRPIAAPAVLPLSLSTGSLTGGLKSNNVKAILKARTANLAEIRGKSKPAALGKVMTEPKVFTSTLSSLKARTEIKDGKPNERNELVAKMRDKSKASNLRKIQDAASVSSGVQASTGICIEKQNPPHPGLKASSPHISALASLQSPVQSPMDTYEISDREDDDKDDATSEDDSDVEPQNKKRIPSWAHKEFLEPALEQQFEVGTLDPDEIFGEVETCDLFAIFEKKKKRYRQRTSSGNWGQDRATTFEKLAYKRTMQFSTEA